MMLKMKKRQDETQNNASQEQPEKTEKERKYSVILYMTALFVVVLAIIGMSWIAQQRRNTKTIKDLTEQHNQVQIKAVENIEALQNENRELYERISVLENSLEEAGESQEHLEAKLAQEEKKGRDDIAALKEHYGKITQKAESRYQLLSNLLKLEKLTSEKNMTEEETAAARAAADNIEPMKGELSEDESELYLDCVEKLTAAEKKIQNNK